MKIFSVFLLLVFFSCTSKTQQNVDENDINIIPKPAILLINGGSFEIKESTQIVSDNLYKGVIDILDKKFESAAGFSLTFADSEQTPASNIIELRLDDKLSIDAYELEVSQSKITIQASSYGGFLYGIESLIQLLPTEIESKSLQSNVVWRVPGVEIKDEPRFKWRGLMLDVSRHFFNKVYIKEVIDGLAMHKMNVLHLHLVDDQGWRIEIKKYPKLTEIGGWRVDQENLPWNGRAPINANEKGTYGGYLSQSDLREIVQYAQEHNVEVIPEIEMPAHVSSAIASYPYLSCNTNEIGVPSGGVWPITDIYCSGKESTFEFLEDVLTEVMDIFPSQYIHIGGDEATKTNWKSCAHCLKRIDQEGLENVEELQSYFIKRVERFINSKGKKLIGWDEILEGGLAPDATVMSWRGVKGGWEASAQGHDVVMTPGTHCYFDHYQGPQNQEPLAIGGYLPLSKVYQFDPVVDSMTVEQAKHVLGGQANLWSEYITTEEHSQYMIYPRLAALSETVWSPKDLRDWDDFSKRLTSTFKRYDYQGLNYAKSAFAITPSVETNLAEKTVNLSLQNEFANADIRYVLDGNELDRDGIKYKAPIKLSETTFVSAAVFKDNGVVGNIYMDTIRFHKAISALVDYTIPYNEKYPGTGKSNMVNTLRGTKNFNDGQWQAWLSQDMEVIIDLGKFENVKQVTLGALENQGPWIYFPTSIEVYLSTDGSSFTKAGGLERPYTPNSSSELKDFKVSFTEDTARYVKVKATNLKESPTGGGVWLFVDEILVE